jgi:hypothetical protein
MACGVAATEVGVDSPVVVILEYIGNMGFPDHIQPAVALATSPTSLQLSNSVDIPPGLPTFAFQSSHAHNMTGI